MAMLIHDERLEKRLQSERAALGGDRFDEVWEGVYVMAAAPNHEHQELVASLTHVLYQIVKARGLGSVLPGVNVSDRVDNWQDNYRIPDVAVLLNNSHAENRGAFWFGGPDFAVEIASANDQTRQKLGFYANVGTRELLIIERDPWQMELFRNDGETFVSAGLVKPADEVLMESEVVSLQLRFGSNSEAISIEAIDTVDGKSWTL